MTGTQLKFKGLRRASQAHIQAHSDAQESAISLAWKDAITIEDVRASWAYTGRNWSLGNAAGAVFSGPQWESCGFVAAKRPAAHGRIIRQWRLRK